MIRANYCLAAVWHYFSSTTHRTRDPHKIKLKSVPKQLNLTSDSTNLTSDSTNLTSDSANLTEKGSSDTLSYIN